jgi:Glycosyl transferases group 1
MRIAQIAPLAESVPPKLYGGTERVVAWLVEELVELGHSVTLFASGARPPVPYQLAGAFCLAVIEAMACGTPVIAFRAGSVPEVIDYGVTGYIVDSQEEAVRAVGLVGKLNRREIRRIFERRFTARRMADDYVDDVAR